MAYNGTVNFRGRSHCHDRTGLDSRDLVIYRHYIHIYNSMTDHLLKYKYVYIIAILYYQALWTSV